jgi:hypothetical protein
MSLSFNNPDFYYVGLRRSRNKNIELYYQMLNNSFNEEDQQFIKFIQEKFSTLETNLFEYFNFNIKFTQLEKLLHKSVDEFFDFVGKDYKIPEPPKSIKRSETTFFKTEVNDDNPCAKFRVLMNKSFFPFSVTKYLDVFFGEVKEVSQQKETENKLVKKVLKLLYFFVEDNPDNCLIALTTGMLAHLSSSGGANSEKILTFIHYCISTLSSYKYELSTTKKWLKYAHKAYIDSFVR